LSASPDGNASLGASFPPAEKFLRGPKSDAVIEGAISPAILDPDQVASDRHAGSRRPLARRQSAFMLSGIMKALYSFYFVAFPDGEPVPTSPGNALGLSGVLRA